MIKPRVIRSVSRKLFALLASKLHFIFPVISLVVDVTAYFIECMCAKRGIRKSVAALLILLNALIFWKFQLFLSFLSLFHFGHFLFFFHFGHSFILAIFSFFLVFSFLPFYHCFHFLPFCHFCYFCHFSFQLREK